MLHFIPGRKYYRADLKELAGLQRDAKGGLWDTGIVEHDGEFLIFTNIGTEGRTGHNYDNRWEGDFLRWSHKRGSHSGWASVKKLLATKSVVHVFWRTSNAAPFEYAGCANAVEVLDRSPVEILWSFNYAASDGEFFRGPDEIAGKEFAEGVVRQVQVNAYERNRAARHACISHYGPGCVVCGLVFRERYGTLGEGYIHVHHLVAISEIGVSYKVDPIQDLRPICPNCHAIVHCRYPPLSIEDVRKQLND